MLSPHLDLVPEVRLFYSQGPSRRGAGEAEEDFGCQSYGRSPGMFPFSDRQCMKHEACAEVWICWKFFGRLTPICVVILPSTPHHSHHLQEAERRIKMMGPQETSVCTAELEINDFPQQVRWKFTNRVCFPPTNLSFMYIFATR